MKQPNQSRFLGLFLLLFLCLTSIDTSQAQEQKKLMGKFTYQGREFNLQPDAFLRPKYFKYTDYGYKLGHPGKHPAKKDFMEEFSKEDIYNFKTIYQDEYAYYQEAIVYFNKLTDRVLTCFTVKELWYIYQFDQDLKKKLLYF